MNNYCHTNLFHFFVIICTVFFHGNMVTTASAKTAYDQEGSLMVIPCTEELLLKSSYKLPALPKTAQTKLLFSVHIAPAENNQLQATLVTTRFNKKTSLYEPNSTSAQSFTDNSIAKVLYKVLTDLKKRSIQIKTVLFASEADLVSLSIPTQKNDRTPWLNLASGPVATKKYAEELPLTIPSFAAIIMELKNVYAQQFHTIALTQAPCSIECAYELAPATTYFVTTNPTNNPSLDHVIKILSLEKKRSRESHYLDTRITEDMDIAPSLFAIIYNWFNSKDEAAFSKEKNEEPVSLDMKNLAALTRNYMNAAYNVIECQKTIAITQHLSHLLNNFFGQPGAINHKKGTALSITTISGLDQMTLKLIGSLFFEEIINQDIETNNHQIDAVLLCTALSKAISERIEALTPQKMTALFRNIYMKNKHIIPLLTEIKQLAEETHLLIMQATQNGSASLYIPFPDQVANDAFPESKFLYETRMDRLYLLLQIHLLMHEEAAASL